MSSTPPPAHRDFARSRATNELGRRYRQDYDDAARATTFTDADALLRGLYPDEYDRLYRDALVDVEDEEQLRRMLADWQPAAAHQVAS